MPKYEVLPCKLTDVERLGKGAELSKAIDDLEALEAEKKSAAEVAKKKFERQSGHIRDLSRIIRTGEEDRSVEVYEKVSVPDRRRYTHRFDTGEIVRIREMSQSEVEEHTQGKLWPMTQPAPEAGEPEEVVGA